jgi:hypothetical protein
MMWGKKKRSPENPGDQFCSEMLELISIQILAILDCRASEMEYHPCLELPNPDTATLCTNCTWVCLFYKYYSDRNGSYFVPLLSTFVR